MIGTSRAARLVLGMMLAGAVAGCGLPRTGPSYSEITTTAEAPLPFSVVDVTPAVTTMTTLDERRGFGPEFVGQPLENTAMIARSDVLAIAIWEGVEDGLLARAETSVAQLPPSVVDERGLIFVPYVGTIRAEGRTIGQLREIIRRALAEKTLNPQVDIAPVETKDRTVAVQGMVNLPGIYPIDRATRRLLPMVARAGGIREDPEVILLRLRRGDATGAIWVQDLYDVPELNIALRPGDTIVAERDRRTFTVLGAVGGQSTVPFPKRDLSVIEALGQVGGLRDNQADPTGIFLFREEAPEIAAQVLTTEGVKRGADEGTRIAYIIDLTDPAGMFLARDFKMRDGDTIFVTNAPFVKWQKILQSFSPVLGFTSSVRTLTGN